MITESSDALPTDLVSRIAELMYAENFMLRDGALDVVDAAASKYGRFVNTAKTEIMVVGQPMTRPTFNFPGKELLVQDMWASPKLSIQQKWMSIAHSFWSFSCCVLRNVDMDAGSDTQARCHSFLLSIAFVYVKLTIRHRLETIREQCRTSSIELIVCRWTFQWMGRVLRMDEHCWLRQGNTNIRFSWDVQLCNPGVP
eukprot:365396-Chlamydomonas_euryale.AAC.28